MGYFVDLKCLAGLLTFGFIWLILYRHVLNREKPGNSRSRKYIYNLWTQSLKQANKPNIEMLLWIVTKDAIPLSKILKKKIGLKFFWIYMLET